MVLSSLVAGTSAACCAVRGSPSVSNLLFLLLAWSHQTRCCGQQEAHKDQPGGQTGGWLNQHVVVKGFYHARHNLDAK